MSLLLLLLLSFYSKHLFSPKVWVCCMDVRFVDTVKMLFISNQIVIRVAVGVTTDFLSFSLYGKPVKFNVHRSS